LIDQTQLVGAEPPKEEEKDLFRIDIACGDNKHQGFVGVDICKTDSVDIVHDLSKYPWPFEDNSVDEAVCSHYFEHLEGFKERAPFMNELYRILKPGRGATIITPRALDRQFQDGSHKYPPVVEGTYLYFNLEWLTANRLLHYRDLHGINCDFAIHYASVQYHPMIAGRSDEFRQFAATQFANAVMDLNVVVVKR